MKKKIAIIGTMPGGGISGGRLLAWYLGETLASSGYEVDFITNRTPTFYSDVKQFTRIKIKKVLIWNRISRKLKFLNGRAFFPIKNYDLSIIVPQRQDFNLHINMLKIAKKHSQKTILLNFETPNWYNYVSNYQIDDHEWDGWKYIGNNCDLILSISKESKKWAQLFFKKETKHNYFYTGINTNIADSVTNVTKNKKQILIISRFGTHKGLSNFNEFFNELEHGLEVVIIIGVHNKAFSKNIHELNLIAQKSGVKLTFKFNVSEFEKFKIIKESSLLVFPSFFEASIILSSSAVGGYSEVVNTEIRIVMIDAAAPIPNAQ